jgi:hypothetical protein
MIVDITPVLALTAPRAFSDRATRIRWLPRRWRQLPPRTKRDHDQRHNEQRGEDIQRRAEAEADDDPGQETGMIRSAVP